MMSATTYLTSPLNWARGLAMMHGSAAQLFRMNTNSNVIDWLASDVLKREYSNFTYWRSAQRFINIDNAHVDFVSFPATLSLHHCVLD